MLLFLDKAHSGISLNNITFRQPTHIYYSDACPFGLGGYNHWGKAWRWSIPPELRFKATINMLEHIASTIGPWIDILNDDLPPSSCTLSMTDSTTSAGWLRKSNFANVDETKLHTQAKMKTSRMHASRLLKHDIREYSQWFPGNRNVVADSLSRDFHINDNSLTNLFRSNFPQQIPPRFNIAPLPLEISSWICAWLREMPNSQQRLEEHQPSTIEHGFDGSNSWKRLIFPAIFSSNPSIRNIKSPSFLHSPTPSGEQIILDPKFLDWLAKRSEIPSTMWRRPFGSTNSVTQDLTTQADLHQFYSPNTRPTKVKTHHRSNRKRFLDASSHSSTNSLPLNASEQ